MVEALTLSNPALMSRNRGETSSVGLWRLFTSWMRGRQASEELGAGRERHWFGWGRPFDLATADSLTVITRSRTFEMVLRWTMTRNEAGES